MLQRIKLIQIGDVHLPSAALIRADMDDKDDKFPGALKNIISKTPLKTVFRRVDELLMTGQFDGLLFMGDLTDVGKLEGYKACVSYIQGSLRLGPGRSGSALAVGLVPGNHDIDRRLALEPGLKTKFLPLAQCLSATGFLELPVEHPTPKRINRDGHLADIFLLNSCWGCGEPEYIPELFRDDIAAAIKRVLAGPDADRALRIYYDRQLDTPAVSDSSIEKVIAGIEASPGNCLPILVAHHNLLPQQQTRLAPYTELVNGGRLRGSLLGLRRPILYLHGHIHEDPIEVLHEPHGAPVVVVSAPDALKGFNVIEIVFTRLQTPLSLRIIKHRFDGSGVIKASQPISVPIVGRGQRGASEQLQLLYSKLLGQRQCYWSEVEALAKSTNPLITSDEILEALEMLSADDRVLIDNYELPPQNWIVRAQI